MCQGTVIYRRDFIMWIIYAISRSAKDACVPIVCICIGFVHIEHNVLLTINGDKTMNSNVVVYYVYPMVIRMCDCEP